MAGGWRSLGWSRRAHNVRTAQRQDRRRAVGATVLVADDERSTADLAKLYLGKEGYRVETATDGQEALDKAHEVHPDLVILDIMMPTLDGWEVCRRLRKERDTPIIILTARTSAVDKITGLELGADDYITKPFNPRELVARVAAVLRRSQPSLGGSSRATRAHGA
jgi:DNA-binding response OmpR family regulator